jgi:hypothetical protein
LPAPELPKTLKSEQNRYYDGYSTGDTTYTMIEGLEELLGASFLGAWDGPLLELLAASLGLVLVDAPFLVPVPVDAPFLVPLDESFLGPLDGSF